MLLFDNTNDLFALAYAHDPAEAEFLLYNRIFLLQKRLIEIHNILSDLESHDKHATVPILIGVTYEETKAEIDIIKRLLSTLRGS